MTLRMLIEIKQNCIKNLPGIGFMRNSLLTAIIFISYTTSINAQTISGYVKDKLTSKNINDAEIVIESESGDYRDTAFTDQFGKWVYSFATSSINEIPLVPEVIEVDQNYPNPFNPSTKINFSLNKSADITIAVHNILGKLIDKRSFSLSKGYYSVNWEAKGGAGVYFYTISSTDFNITKKMIQLDGSNGRGIIGLSHSDASKFFQNSENINLLEKSITANYRIITSKFGYFPDTLLTTITNGQVFNIKITTIHHNAVLVDLHNDILERIADNPGYSLGDYHNYYHTDIPRLKLGGVKVQFFSVWVNPNQYSNNALERAVQMADRFDLEMFENADEITQVFSYGEIMQTIDENKIAAVLAVEGGYSIENSLEKLDYLYKRGMRYMTITWNNSLDWAVAASDSRSTTVGLNDFGRDVIRTMDSLGIIIDVSHTGIKTIEDILEVTTNPIVATHSGVRALKDHTRNLYDSQILDIAESGGVIGVVFYPPFLGNGTVNIKTVINHINYIVNLVGIEHVGIGSDFDGIGTNVVQGLEDVTKFPDLTIELLNEGYSVEDINKILGQNVLRVFKQVCK